MVMTNLNEGRTRDQSEARSPG